MVVSGILLRGFGGAQVARALAAEARSVGQRGLGDAVRILKYIEKCTGTNHNGPAWIAYVEISRSGRTVYFNGCALQAYTRGGGVGSHCDLETRESYWVSGVKKSGSNRQWAGSGHILVEQSAVAELLSLPGQTTLDKSLYRVVPDLPITDPQQFVERFNEEL